MPWKGQSRGRGQRTTRRMEWKGAANDGLQTLGAGAIAGFYVVLPSEARAMTSPTLVRAIGWISIFRAGTLAGHGAWGLITWDDNDDTVPADLPDPHTRPDLSWIAHGYYAVSSGETRVGEVSIGRPTFDVKSSRKLPDPRGILFVWKHSATSAGTINFNAGIRCLLKE